MVATIGHSQTYAPAALTLANGAVLKGEVQYRWPFVFKKVIIRQADGKEVQFDPIQVKTLEITRPDKQQERFVSRIVRVNVSSDNLSSLEEKIAPVMQHDTVLIRTVVQGLTNLYDFKDQHGKLHFFIERDSVEELIYKRFLRTGGGLGNVMENKQFLEQIDRYFKNCPAILRELPYLRYTQADFLKVFKLAASCNLTRNDYFLKKEGNTVDFQISAGISHTYLRFRDNAYLSTNYRAYNYKEQGIQPSFGLLLEWYLKSTNKQMSLVNELGYWAYDLKGRYDHYYPDFVYTNEIKKGVVRDGIMFRYHFFNNHPENAFFLEAGVSAGLIVWDKSTTENNFNNVVTKSSLTTVDNKFEFGGIAGLGYKWNRVAVEWRVEFCQNTLQNNEYGLSLPLIYSTALFMKVNYRLF
jgi:hypothetical protein